MDAPTDPLRSFDDRTAERVSALFDGAVGRPRRRRRRGALVGLAVLAVAAVGVALGPVASGTSGDVLRTAPVTTRDVDTQITGVATVTPVSQAALAFPASGTVAKVEVAVGQVVAAGQPLATLDTTGPTQVLHQQQAAAAQARLTLAKDLAGGTTGAAAPTAPVAARPTTPGSDMTAARQGVATAQAAVDTAMAAERTAMSAAETACPAVTDAPPSRTAGTAGTAGTTDRSATTSATTTTLVGTGPGTNPGDCIGALGRVQSAQADVASAQSALTAVSVHLDESLSAANPSAATSSSTGTGASAPPATRGSGATPGSGSVTGSTTTTVSAADVVAAQAAVDAADLHVAVAVQSLARSTITSPIAGTVVSIGVGVGDAVTAGSSTERIMVQGTGGYEVVTDVGIADIAEVRVGQTATVTPDGSSRPLDGTVVAVSPTPDQQAAGTSFQVTVALADPGVDLENGSTGTVTITTADVRSALVVPTSAVTTDGTTSTVVLSDDAGTHTRAVTLGAVGVEWTQIRQGLVAGDRVVIADRGRPLPESATASPASSGPGSTSSRGGPTVRPGRSGFPAGAAARFAAGR